MSAEADENGQSKSFMWVPLLFYMTMLYLSHGKVGKVSSVLILAKVPGSSTASDMDFLFISFF